MTRLSGEARNAIVAATSSTFGQPRRSAFGIDLRLAGVSMIDGATAFTRMPSLADLFGQRDRHRRDRRPCRRIGHHAGAAAPFQRRTRRDIDDTAATLPHRLHERARQHRKQATKLMSTWCIRLALSASTMALAAKPPARWIEAQSFGPTPP